MKNDMVNNWLQEIYTINPHIGFEHIKGKENILADSLSRLKILGLYETNTPEKEGHGYSKFVFNLEPETVCNIDRNQKVNQAFEIDSMKYQLDTEHEDDLSSPDTVVKPKLQDPLQCMSDLTEVKQLHGQDMHLSKIIAKCTSHSHHDKTSYYFNVKGLIINVPLVQ